MTVGYTYDKKFLIMWDEFYKTGHEIQKINLNFYLKKFLVFSSPTKPNPERKTKFLNKNSLI